MSENDRLRADALWLARHFGQAVLLVLAPPPSCVPPSARAIPYITLLRDACDAERACVASGQAVEVRPHD